MWHRRSAMAVARCESTRECLFCRSFGMSVSVGVWTRRPTASHCSLLSALSPPAIPSFVRILPLRLHTSPPLPTAALSVHRSTRTRTDPTNTGGKPRMQRRVQLVPRRTASSSWRRSQAAASAPLTPPSLPLLSPCSSLCMFSVATLSFGRWPVSLSLHASGQPLLLS